MRVTSRTLSPPQTIRRRNRCQNRWHVARPEGISDEVACYAACVDDVGGMPCWTQATTACVSPARDERGAHWSRLRQLAPCPPGGWHGRTRGACVFPQRCMARGKKHAWPSPIRRKSYQTVQGSSGYLSLGEAWVYPLERGPQTPRIPRRQPYRGSTEQGVSILLHQRCKQGVSCDLRSSISVGWSRWQGLVLDKPSETTRFQNSVNFTYSLQ